jgi:glutamate synthase domain-containing protein 3
VAERDAAVHAATGLLLEALDERDEQTLRELLAELAARTGSPVAAELLARWEPARFTKVLPHDYRAVLDQPLSAGGIGFVTRETEAVA